MKVFIDTVIVDGEEKGKLYLESDAMQFILKEYYTTQKGDEGQKTHGYFTNVHFALQHFLKMKIMQSTATTLRELQEDVAGIRRYIESSLPLELFHEAHSERTDVVEV